ncbi:hypothetical protein [Streptomyces sioyaensis]|uniref:hypothetical protein n=1 Tax=Streptomyces sioyaensis TaxID=67364 RepID=UPI0037AA67C0
MSEGRRAEGLALLERFIQAAAEAERLAFTRHSEWDDTHAWCLTLPGEAGEASWGGCKGALV